MATTAEKISQDDSSSIPKNQSGGHALDERRRAALAEIDNAHFS